MRLHHRVTIALACAALLAAPLSAQQGQKARIVVRLPAAAKLYVENTAYPGTGPVRTVETPALEAGLEYTYDLRAVVTRDGGRFSLTRTVPFRAGQTVNADLTALEPGAAAKATAASKAKRPPAGHGAGLSHATPTIAGLQPSGEVLVRQYLTVYHAAPVRIGNEGQPPPAPPSPKVEVQEHRMYFKADDVRAFDLDGNPVDPAVWKAALAKEAPVLFAGYAVMGGPPGANGAPTAKRADDAGRHSPVALVDDAAAAQPVAFGKGSVDVNPLASAVYKKGTLILQGTRQPVRQERGKGGADLPAGHPPRPAVAVVEDGDLRVIERHEHGFDMPITMTVKAKAPDGSVVEQQATAMLTNTHENINTRELPVEAARVFDTAGKPVPAKTLTERLARETPVLIVDGSGPADELYLRAAQPGVLVVALPQMGYHGGGTIMPGPAPVAPAAPKKAPAAPKSPA